jgi:sugar/nucleoside kinase (ribokinase family)
LLRGSDRRAAIAMKPGGSGANQAAWLGRLGVPTAFVGRVGRADRETYAELLGAYGVAVRLGGDPRRPTGMLVTILDPDGERSFLTDRGANEGLDAGDLPEALLRGTGLLHISGYALFSAGPRAAILGLADIARRRGIPVSVDPGSAGFLAEVCPAEFLRWTEGATLFFPNAEEAALLAGTADPDAQMEALCRRYAFVAIKRGAAGAEAGRGAERWEASAPEVEVVDTTGAGDAFLAGFLAAWMAGAEIGDCLARAVATGSQAVTTLGGQPAP